MKISMALLVLAVGAWPVASPAQDEAPAAGSLGQPGFLVIDGAADSSGVFKEIVDPELGVLKLTWDQGSLTLPDSLALENWGPFDKGVAFTAALSGTGESGRLVLDDGIFPVTEPVLLTDGRLELAIDSGELEIQGARIIYRRHTSSREDFRSGLLLLAGMTLLVIVLLRRARIKAAARVGD